MSAAPKPAKIRRQGQAMAKHDAHYRLSLYSNKWLEELSERFRTSKAKVLDAILRSKPEPDEFYLR